MTYFDCCYAQPSGPQVAPESTLVKTWKYAFLISIISAIALAVTILLTHYPTASTIFYAVSIPLLALSLITFVVTSVKRCQPVA